MGYNVFRGSSSKVKEFFQYLKNTKKKFKLPLVKPLGASLWHCQPGLSSWPEQFFASVSLVYNYYKLR